MGSNVIELTGNGIPQIYKAASVMKPGNLVSEANGVATLGEVALKGTTIYIVKENSAFSKDIDDEYALDEQVRVFVPIKGSRCQLRLKPASANIVKGDMLALAALGTVAKTTTNTEEFVYAVANEDCTVTGNGSPLCAATIM